MTFLKQIFLLAVIAASFGYFYYVWNRSPCYRPIEYSVETFSEKFGISEEDFLLDLEEAEKIWERDAGKELFTRVGDAGGGGDSALKGELKVNLIYDDRQAVADRNETLEFTVEEVTEKAKITGDEYEEAKTRYDSLNKEYDAAAGEYQAALKAYNSRVDFWNAKGGAPANEYSKLTVESKKFSLLSADLDGRVDELASLVKEVNALAEKYNSLVQSANRNIDIINQTADREFEQGEHISDGERWEINIYEFTDRTELVRVLAHEFGHALGIDHNPNEESIMHYLNQSESLKLSKEDKESLVSACKLDTK